MHCVLTNVFNFQDETLYYFCKIKLSENFNKIHYLKYPVGHVFSKVCTVVPQRVHY